MPLHLQFFFKTVNRVKKTNLFSYLCHKLGDTGISRLLNIETGRFVQWYIKVNYGAEST